VVIGETAEDLQVTFDQHVTPTETLQPGSVTEAEFAKIRALIGGDYVTETQRQFDEFMSRDNEDCSVQAADVR